MFLNISNPYALFFSCFHFLFLMLYFSPFEFVMDLCFLLLFGDLKFEMFIFYVLGIQVSSCICLKCSCTSFWWGLCFALPLGSKDHDALVCLETFKILGSRLGWIWSKFVEWWLLHFKGWADLSKTWFSQKLFEREVVSRLQIREA